MTEKADVLQKLDTIRNEADRIMKLFENGRVPQARAAHAQESLRALKEKLQAEYKRMNTIKGEAALADIELRYYKPAIDDAWANTALGSVRWNSRPDNRWLDALWSVADYMSYWGGNLKSAAEKQALKPGG